LMDHKTGSKFEWGRNILTNLVLSRAGPNWMNFSEIWSIRAESQNPGVGPPCRNYTSPLCARGWREWKITILEARVKQEWKIWRGHFNNCTQFDNGILANLFCGWQTGETQILQWWNSNYLGASRPSTCVANSRTPVSPAASVALREQVRNRRRRQRRGDSWEPQGCHKGLVLDGSTHWGRHGGLLRFRGGTSLRRCYRGGGQGQHWWDPFVLGYTCTHISTHVPFGLAHHVYPLGSTSSTSLFFFQGKLWSLLSNARLKKPRQV
jgi:hypothetical protein